VHYFNVPGELRDSKYPVALHSFQIIRFAWRLLSRISYVLVVPSEPQPRFIPPIRCPVEPLVHSPERVEAARVSGVCVVDDAVGECERAHARRLAGVGGDVGAGHGREIAYASRVGCRAERAVVVVDAAGALLLLGERGVEVVIEIAVQRRGPRERPAHAALVGLERDDWGT
jgi:hypothetical protein